MQDIDKTIFVSIASYRDPDCKNTLSNLFANAENPARVFVGICEQNAPLEEKEKCSLQDAEMSEKFRHHVRKIQMHHQDARGPTFARYLCTTLWNNEDYFFQLDSHMRLVKNWDSKLIKILTDLQKETKNEKIVLSTYVDTKENYERHMNNDPLVVNNSPRMCQAFFNEHGMISFHGAHNMTHDKPVQVPFAAGGFVFSQARQMIDDVPMDPYLDDVFVGEEILHSVRFWTHGYDIYTPHMHIVFHDYTRSNDRKFWENERDDSEGTKRTKHILKLSKEKPEHAKKYLERYGLGKVRTLQSFWDFAGIDPESETVSKNFCTPEKIEKDPVPEHMIADRLYRKNNPGKPIPFVKKYESRINWVAFTILILVIIAIVSYVIYSRII